MYCMKCGKKVPDGAGFCPYCGARLPEVNLTDISENGRTKDQPTGVSGNGQSKNQPGASGNGQAGGTGNVRTQQGQKPADSPIRKAAEPGKGGKKRLFAVIAVIAVIAVVAIGLLTRGTGRKTFEAGSFIRVSYYGKDGEGKISLSYDTGRAVAWIKQNAKEALSAHETDQLSDLLSGLDSYYSVSPSENLSNGDQVTITAKLDNSQLEDLLSDYGLRLSSGSVQDEVEGLAAPLVIRAADYIQVKMEGFDGSGYISTQLDLTGLRKAVYDQAVLIDPSIGQSSTSYEDLYYSDMDVYDCLSPITVSASTWGDLKNGDSVELTADISQSTGQIEKYDITLEGGQTEFTVEGLPETLTLDLKPYLAPQYEGFDGDGTLSLTSEEVFDFDRMAEGIADLLSSAGRSLYDSYSGPWSTFRTVGASDSTEAAGETEEETVSEAQTQENVTESAGDVSGQDDLQDEVQDVLELVRLYLRGNNIFELDADKTSDLSNGDRIHIACVPWGTEYSWDDYAQASEQSSENVTEQSAEGAVGQTSENVTEQSAEDAAEQTSENMTDLSAENVSESSEQDAAYLYQVSYLGLNIRGFIAEETVEDLTAVETVELDTYVNKLFSGYDGNGILRLSLDTDRMTRDLTQKLKEDHRGAFLSAQAQEEAVESGALPEEWVQLLNDGTDAQVSQNVSDESDALEGQNVSGESDAQASQNVSGESDAQVTGLASNEAGTQSDEYYEAQARFLVQAVAWLLDQDILEISAGSEYGIREGDQVHLTCTLSEEYQNYLAEGTNYSDAFWQASQLIRSEEDLTFDLAWLGLRVQGFDEQITAEGLTAQATVDLSSYAYLTFDGFDGAGTAHIRIDGDKLTQALSQVQTGRGDDNISAEALSSYIVNNVGNWFRTEGTEDTLKNGDTVTVSASVTGHDGEDRVHAHYGLIIPSFEVTGTVSGLTQPEAVDLADAVTITFSGICPRVYVDIDVDETLDYLSATDLQDQRLMILALNGDTYQGTVSYDEKRMLRMGYTVSNAAYSAQVSGLPTYVVDYSLQEASDSLNTQTLNWKEALDDSISQTDMAQVTAVTGLDASWIDWEAAQTVCDSIFAVTAGEQPRRENGVYWIYQVALPVNERNQGYTQTDVWYMVSGYEVIQEADGSLRAPMKTASHYYASKEEALEQISADRESIFGTGSDIQTLQQAKEPLTLELGEVSPAVAITAAGTPGTGNEVALRMAVASAGLDGHQYYVYDTVNGAALTWDAANAFCEAAGGHLATITSAREQALVRYLVDLEETVTNRYYIGLTDAAHEGAWRWVTGERYEYTAWNDGEPNNGNGGAEEDYAEESYGSNMSWNDAAGDIGIGFILEIEPADEDAAGAAGTSTLVADQTAWLSDLAADSSLDDAWFDIYRQDSYGNMHYMALTLDAGNRGAAQFYPGRAYQTLELTLGMDSGAANEASVSVGIWGDDVLLYELEAYDRSEAPIELSLDVSGVETLSIQVSGDNAGGSFVIVDGRLGASQELAADPSDRRYAREKAALQDVGTFYQDNAWNGVTESIGLFRDALGKAHVNFYGFNAAASGSVISQLGQQYTHFSAIISPVEAEGASGIGIYADDTLLWSMERYDSSMGYVRIDLDVQGAETLTVRTWPADPEQNTAQLFLTDVFLEKGDTAAEQTADAGGSWLESDPDVTLQAADLLPEPYADQLARALQYDGKIYCLFDDPVSFRQAVSACREMGGSLLAPMTSDENAAAAALLNQCISNGRHWIGASAAARNSEEADWYWQDGQNVLQTVSGWRAELPWAQEGQYLTISGDGGWSSASAEDRYGFIAVLEPGDTSSEAFSDSASGDAETSIASEDRSADEAADLAEPDDALSAFSGGSAQESGHAVETIRLTDLECQASDEAENDVSAIYDPSDRGDLVFYPHAATFSTEDSAFASYVLAGEYEQFTGTFFSSSEAMTGRKLHLAVFGDGKLLWEDPDYTVVRGNAAVYEPFTVDVSGVHELTVSAVRTDGSSGRVSLICGTLTRASVPDYSPAARLYNIESVAESGLARSDSVYDVWTDRRGLIHGATLRLDASAGGNVLYNLNGQYASLDLMLGSSYRESFTQPYETVSIRFYVDDELVWEKSDFSLYDAQVPVSLDLTGASTLEIETDSAGESANYIWLNEAVLE